MNNTITLQNLRIESRLRHQANEIIEIVKIKGSATLSINLFVISGMWFNHIEKIEIARNSIYLVDTKTYEIKELTVGMLMEQDISKIAIGIDYITAHTIGLADTMYQETLVHKKGE